MHCSIVVVPVHVHGASERHVNDFLEDLLDDVEGVVQNLLDEHPHVEIVPTEEGDSLE